MKGSQELLLSHCFHRYWHQQPLSMVIMTLWIYFCICTSEISVLTNSQMAKA